VAPPLRDGRTVLRIAGPRARAGDDPTGATLPRDTGPTSRDRERARRASQQPYWRTVPGTGPRPRPQRPSDDPPGGTRSRTTGQPPRTASATSEHSKKRCDRRTVVATTGPRARPPRPRDDTAQATVRAPTGSSHRHQEAGLRELATILTLASRGESFDRWGELPAPPHRQAQHVPSSTRTHDDEQPRSTNTTLEGPHTMRVTSPREHDARLLDSIHGPEWTAAGEDPIATRTQADWRSHARSATPRRHRHAHAVDGSDGGARFA